MRSKISERILSETPQEIKDKVNIYADKLVSSVSISCIERAKLNKVELNK